MGRERRFPSGGNAFAPPSSFSPAEKVKRKRISALRASLRSVALRNAPAGAAAGVEEKEGFSPSVRLATPAGAVRLFAKHCFSCGLRPKAAAAGKSRVSIFRHLSGQNNIAPVSGSGADGGTHSKDTPNGTTFND